MNGNTLFATNKSQPLGGGCFDIDSTARHAEISGNIRTHCIDKAGQLRRLCNHGYIGIAKGIVLASEFRHDSAQQFAAIDIFVLCIGVREVAANIPQRGGAQQGVTVRGSAHRHLSAPVGYVYGECARRPK